MADSQYGSPEGQDSIHRGNNKLLESTLARMASYFERQENMTNGGEQSTTEVLEDVALKRFQKFYPLRFNEKERKEIAEGWIESMNDIYDALRYSEERKVAFGKY